MQCKGCGANLPDQARFCLQCGTAVGVDPDHAHSQPAAKLDFIQPALAGGMFLGFLSSMPFISIGNVCCCMWVMLGGGLGVILLTRQRPAGITYGDGAFVGVLSGLFGAIIGTALQIPIQIIAARMIGSQQQQLEDFMRQFPIEGPMREWILRMASGEISVGTVAFTFVGNLLMWSLFAMIGGILAVAILNKRGTRGQTPRPLINP